MPKTTSWQKLRKESFEFWIKHPELTSSDFTNWWLTKFQAELTAICEMVEGKKVEVGHDENSYDKEAEAFNSALDKALEVIRGRMK